MLVMSKGGLSLGQAETYYDEKYAQQPSRKSSNGSDDHVANGITRGR